VKVINDEIIKITKKYENLQCKDCAKELWDFLKKKWVEFEKVILKW